MTSKAIATLITQAFNNGNMLLACGNGGSSAQASHLVAEFLCKVRHNRTPLPAVSLNDPGVITAIGNDFGFEEIFARQVAALGKEGDILVALSTSGKSPNVLKAIEIARQKRMVVIELPKDGKDTQEIQENQLIMIHEVATLVENDFYDYF